MASTEQLVNTLKRELRRNHITYSQVGEELQLSETSVKRMFATGQFTLDRLSAISALVKWDWTDLADAARNNEKMLDHLSEEQEREIADDIELLLIAVSVINGFTFLDLISQYQFSEPQCIRKLARLDKLNLIELLPGNRIRLKISTNFRWNPRGPIQKYFLDVVVQEFFDTSFAGEQEKLIVMNALLTDSAHQHLQQRMDKLASEMSEAMQRETALPLQTKKGNTLVVALRRWKYKPFVSRARG